jgi:hypothetical protein
MVANCILLEKRDQNRNSFNPKCVTEPPVKMQRMTASKEGAQASKHAKKRQYCVGLLLSSSRKLLVLALKLIAVLTTMDG